MSTSPSHSLLRDELLSDQSDRWQRGEHVPVESYLEQYPDLGDDVGVLLDLITNEVRLRLDNGESPSLNEYLLRFPLHCDAVRDQWQFIGLLHSGLRTALLATESDPRHGTAGDTPQVPGYEILGELGRGGMGIVYQARQINLDRVVALKTIAGAGPGAYAMMRARFLTEAMAVARLRHPGVVGIFDLGEHAGVIYYTMEFLPGGSLQDRLRRGPLPPREAAAIVARLARAMHTVHQMNVIHRDLKPGNVLIDADGSPRVSDFGLAKLLDDTLGMTETGVPLGTVEYMAPEQAAGNKEVGPAADVYGLGGILYACLTGRPPFAGKPRDAVLHKVIHEAPTPPRRRRAEVPRELEAVCLKCLTKRAADRYPTALALAEDLEAWLEGGKLQAYDADAPSWLFFRLTAAVVLLGVLAAGWSALTRQAEPPSGRRDDPLAALAAQLRRDGSVRLIGSQGGPQWAALVLGGQQATHGIDLRQQFFLAGWQVTLLELLPHVDTSHYVLSAEVLHQRSSPNGGVGVFVAGRRQRLDGGPIYSYLLVRFNNFHAPPGPDTAAALRAPAGAVRRATNRVAVSARVTGDFVNAPSLNLRHRFAQPRLFSPRPAEWRFVVVEVAPHQVCVWWQGQLVARVPRQLLQVGLEGQRQTALNNPRPHLFLRDVDTRFDPRGAVGLYVYDGRAAFRNVRLGTFPSLPTP